MKYFLLHITIFFGILFSPQSAYSQVKKNFVLSHQKLNSPLTIHNKSLDTIYFFENQPYKKPLPNTIFINPAKKLLAAPAKLTEYFDTLIIAEDGYNGWLWFTPDNEQAAKLNKTFRNEYIDSSTFNLSNKIIAPFYISNQYVTKSDYWVFVKYVRDSIARKHLFRSGWFNDFVINDYIEYEYLDWKKNLDWNNLEYRDFLLGISLPVHEQFKGSFEIDARLLKYVSPISHSIQPIFPDTLCWAFANIGNKFESEKFYLSDIYTKYYNWNYFDSRRKKFVGGSFFKNKAEPIAGVSYEQALAYLEWRTLQHQTILNQKHIPLTVKYSFPTVFELNLLSEQQNIQMFDSVEIHLKKAQIAEQWRITNKEYLQFIHWVRDSVGHEILFAAGFEQFKISEDEIGAPNDFGFINWNEKIDWNNKLEIADAGTLANIFLSKEESYYGIRELDTRKLMFDYYWFNFLQATEIRNRFGFNTAEYNGDIIDGQGYKAPIRDRASFIFRGKNNIYPDTLPLYLNKSLSLASLGSNWITVGYHLLNLTDCYKDKCKNVLPYTIPKEYIHDNDFRITNREYRKFIEWVKDSIAHELCFNAGLEKYKITLDYNGVELDPPLINWKQKIDWNHLSDEMLEPLQPLFISESERFYRAKNIDTQKLIYKFYLFDFEQAALPKNQFNFNTHEYSGDLVDSRGYKIPVKNRGSFILEYQEPIYPDSSQHATLWNPQYNDSLVEGITNWQAFAYFIWQRNYDAWHKHIQLPQILDMNKPEYKDSLISGITYNQALMYYNWAGIDYLPTINQWNLILQGKIPNIPTKLPFPTPKFRYVIRFYPKK